MPLGTLDDRYVAQGYQLRAQGAAAGLASAEGGQRPWMLPDLGAGDLTVPGLAKAFDRSALAALYAQVLTDPEGTTGDAMALKLQSDYLAVQERACRLARSGPVRCALHAGARRAAHGLPGGVFGRVDGYVQDLIVAGATGFTGGV